MDLNRIRYGEIHSFIPICKPSQIRICTAQRYVVCQHKHASPVIPYLLSSK